MMVLQDFQQLTVLLQQLPQPTPDVNVCGLQRTPFFVFLLLMGHAQV